MGPKQAGMREYPTAAAGICGLMSEHEEYSSPVINSALVSLCILAATT